MGMVEPGNCWDGDAGSVPGDEDFDSILSMLDFPMESLEGDGFVGDWDGSNSECLGPIPTSVLMGPPPNVKIDTGPQWPVTRIDATPEQKLLPNYFSESSSSRSVQHNEFTEFQESSTVYQTHSPISVLESSGSTSAQKSLPIKSDVVIPVRTRSKRARPTGPNPWLLLSPPVFASSSAGKKTSKFRKFKEKKKKIVEETAPKPENCSQVSPEFAELQSGSSHRPVAPKKCTHCEVTKTPQWREGPLGPKTLCNACGVRYRSGRLFPEYRPAASPTFVPSLHSNSHKKVIEMRNKGKQPMTTQSEDPPISPQPEFVPMSSYLFDFIY